MICKTNKSAEHTYRRCADSISEMHVCGNKELLQIPPFHYDKQQTISGQIKRACVNFEVCLIYVAEGNRRQCVGYLFGSQRERIVPKCKQPFCEYVERNNLIG